MKCEHCGGQVGAEAFILNTNLAFLVLPNGTFTFCCSTHAQLWYEQRGKDPREAKARREAILEELRKIETRGNTRFVKTA